MSSAAGLPELRLTALAVDDEPANRKVFEQIFRAVGAEVMTAADGREALALLESRRFDVAVVDIHMPGLSGIELVRRLRASQGVNRQAPMIAVTADVFSYGRADFLRLGFDDFLPKPVPVATLVETARRLAARPRPTNEPAEADAPRLAG